MDFFFKIGTIYTKSFIQMKQINCEKFKIHIILPLKQRSPISALHNDHQINEMSRTISSDLKRISHYCHFSKKKIKSQQMWPSVRRAIVANQEIIYFST